MQAEEVVARALGRALGDGERLRHERDGAVADGAGAGVDEAAEVRRAAALAAGAVAVDRAELAPVSRPSLNRFAQEVLTLAPRVRSQAPAGPTVHSSQRVSPSVV